jgi:hypothetical protein
VSLTPEELDVIDRITDAWSAFVALPRCHPTELEELVTHVHALQGAVMERVAVRAHPDRFTHVEGFR